MLEGYFCKQMDGRAVLLLVLWHNASNTGAVTAVMVAGRRSRQLLRYKIRVRKGSLTVTVQESSVCAEQLGRQRSSYLQMRYLGHVTENEFVRMFSGV